MFCLLICTVWGLWGLLETAENAKLDFPLNKATQSMRRLNKHPQTNTTMYFYKWCQCKCYSAFDLNLPQDGSICSFVLQKITVKDLDIENTMHCGKHALLKKLWETNKKTRQFSILALAMALWREYGFQINKLVLCIIH